MSRRLTVTITCEQCSRQECFEVSSVQAEGPIVMSTNLSEAMKRHGWVTQYNPGSSLRPIDTCAACNKELPDATP